MAFVISNAVGKAIYNIFFHPLKDFPGPWLARATPFPYVWRLCNGEMVSWMTKQHLKYGNVVRIEPDELSFTTPSAWSEIFLSRPQLPRPVIGTIVNVNGVRPVVHELKPEDHLRQRKILNHGFSNKALSMQEYILHQYVDILVKRFDEFAASGTEIDITDWYQFATFDITGDLVFGESFGSLEKSVYHPWVATLFSGLKAGSIMTGFTYFPVLRLLGFCIPLFIKNILRLPLYRHFQYSIDQVNKRLARKTERPDIMKFVLEHNHEGGLSKDELDTQMQLLVFAGSETAAATCSAVTWFLLKNPEMMRRLQRELRDAFQTFEEIEIPKASKLPYLNAVLQEGLRLHPPAPTSNPRYVDRPIAVAGYNVPPGVSLPPVTTYEAISLVRKLIEMSIFMNRFELGYHSRLLTICHGISKIQVFLRLSGGSQKVMLCTNQTKRICGNHSWWAKGTVLARGKLRCEKSSAYTKFDQPCIS